jgi:hypothetical protein
MHSSYPGQPRQAEGTHTRGDNPIKMETTNEISMLMIAISKICK